MKRLVLLLLAMMVLIVTASAEELFVEEGFYEAASFDDEFFAEEAFLGEEFEAEQPKLEDEAEDRSVFLFTCEEDQRGTNENLVGWQKWEIRDLKAEEDKNGRVKLSWKLVKGGDVPPTLPDSSDSPTKDEIKKINKDVKVYIYQVDALTGVPTQSKLDQTGLKTLSIKPVALNKNSTPVKVTTSGTYTWYARLEQVDKAGYDLLVGKTSAATEPLTIKTLNDKKIKKLEVFYEYPSAQPADQSREQPVITVSANIHTKEVASSYTIDVTQKNGATGTATYTPADLEKVKSELQSKGYFSVNLYNNSEVTWVGGAAPKLEANGNKITVCVTPNGGSAKKANLKTTNASKTPPQITSAVQVDATHVCVTWYDLGDQSGANPAESYTITAGSAANKKTVLKKDLIVNKDGSYSYNFEVKANTKSNAKKIGIKVKSEARKSRSSKSFYIMLQPMDNCAILNLRYEAKDEGILLTWNTTVSAAFNVYATDSAHSTEIVTTGKLLTAQADQPSGYEASTYCAMIPNKKLARLSKGHWWSFTVKAINDKKVIAREVVYMNKDRTLSEQPAIAEMEGVATEYTSGTKIDFTSLFDSEYELDIVVYETGTKNEAKFKDDGTLPAGTYDVVATAKVNKDLTATVTITVKDAAGPEIIKESCWKVAPPDFTNQGKQGKAVLSDNEMTLTLSNLVLPYEVQTGGPVETEGTVETEGPIIEKEDGAWIAVKIYNEGKFDIDHTKVSWDGYPPYEVAPLSYLIKDGNYFYVWLRLERGYIEYIINNQKEMKIQSTATITEYVGGEIDQKDKKYWMIDIIVDLTNIEITADREEYAKYAIKIVDGKVIEN